jgi:hypothetical protein
MLMKVIFVEAVGYERALSYTVVNESHIGQTAFDLDNRHNQGRC